MYVPLKPNHIPEHEQGEFRDLNMTGTNCTIHDFRKEPYRSFWKIITSVRACCKRT